MLDRQALTSRATQEGNSDPLKHAGVCRQNSFFQESFDISLLLYFGHVHKPTSRECLLVYCKIIGSRIRNIHEKTSSAQEIPLELYQKAMLPKKKKKETVRCVADDVKQKEGGLRHQAKVMHSLANYIPYKPHTC